MTGEVCSMVCAYDKVKVCQTVNRGVRNMCASKAEAALLDLTPTGLGAHDEPPAVDRMFRTVPPPGVCAGDPYLSDARVRAGWTAIAFSRGL